MRFRLYPTPKQERILERHCTDARFVWNLALEQRNYYPLRLCPAPRYIEQCRQLTEARAAFPWLAEGSQTIQQQALRDLDHAFHLFFEDVHNYPGWRKRGESDGFRVVGLNGRFMAYPKRVSKLNGSLYVPKIGWVRFRWSRDPGKPKSYRVTHHPSGCWYVAFAVEPDPIEAPGNGATVGVDRGIVNTLTTSDGEMFHAPTFSPKEAERVVRSQRRLSRAKPGSNRRQRVKRALAKLRAKEAARRKDFIEKMTTDFARRYDVVKVEALDTQRMTRSAKGTRENPGRSVRAKAGLNRAILAHGWGMFARRLKDKARDRVIEVNPQYTSQRCSECGHIDPANRKSQADFACLSCGFTLNADVNAARNIAAGQAVTARGARISKRRATNREPRYGNVAESVGPPTGDAKRSITMSGPCVCGVEAILS